MALNIKESFLTENKSVYDFLNLPGQGLYIPLYQRDYSWDNDNIEQLIEDLTRGIQRIALGEVLDDSKEIRFLGTIISVVEPDWRHIDPVDKEAIPPRIEKLIDGQQRVSTIAIMSTLLVKRLSEIKERVKAKSPIVGSINEICDIWTEKLLTIFSFDLRRGTPRWKPKIVRGQSDYWTRDNSVDEAYKSELSNYLGHFIEAHFTEGLSYPKFSDRQNPYYGSAVYKNGRRIEEWLKKDVAMAHIEQSDDFATAWSILAHLSQSSIWEYERPDLCAIIEEKDFSDKRADSYILCELVQTLSVCHYLLDRCCFTIIQPTNEEWAFDMFQSLNATGTPLTAIETFKPMIVNTVEKTFHEKFKDSKSGEFFKKVESFLSDEGTATAQQKNKRTNDFLTSFFVAEEGIALSTHFSLQRKELLSVYEKAEGAEEKLSFVKRMGNYADFYQKWSQYDIRGNKLFPDIGADSDADVASLLLSFLKSSNHKMAITILARMYSEVLDGKPNATSDFTSTVKAIAAYYFIWRTALSNSGLDSSYRDFFKQLNEPLTISVIRHYFGEKLKEKEINTFDRWKEKARGYCKYDSTGKEIIRLALILCAHDVIPDEDNPGLMKRGKDGCCKYLCLDKWSSPSLRTIEHIAPQTNNGDWDESLYDPILEPYQTLGNLTLLPQKLNSSAGNKGWIEKLLYYRCVSENDEQKLAKIGEQATELSISWNLDTQEMLMECEYNAHLKPLSVMNVTDKWDKDLVDKRTEKMLSIIWDRVSNWIFSE